MRLLPEMVCVCVCMCSFLQECVSTTQKLKQYMEELNGSLLTVSSVFYEIFSLLGALFGQVNHYNGLRYISEF